MMELIAVLAAVNPHSAIFMLNQLLALQTNNKNQEA